MSHAVHCDTCGRAGRRLRGRACPEGWQYGESHSEDSAEVFVVYACSQVCATKFFKAGPGCLHPSVEVHPTGLVKCNWCDAEAGACSNELQSKREHEMCDYNPRGVCTYCGSEC